MHNEISISFLASEECCGSFQNLHNIKWFSTAPFSCAKLNTNISNLLFVLVQRSPPNSNSSAHPSMDFRSSLLVVNGSTSSISFRWIGIRTMGDSQPESSVFSVRIVSVDYYLAPPIPGLGICYSSFQGILYISFALCHGLLSLFTVTLTMAFIRFSVLAVNDSFRILCVNFIV